MGYSEGLASLALRAKFARWLLLAYAAASLLLIPVVFVRTSVAGNVGIDFRIILIAVGTIAIIELIVLFGLIIAIPLWVYRARANLSVMGLVGLRYSPTWSALSFLVPIVGLFVPFMAMRQIYNSSMGENEYQLNASAPDVTSWWACYVAGTLVQAFLLMVALFNLNGMVFIVTPQLVSNLFFIFDTLLLVGAVFFLWRIIGNVTRAQASLTGIAQAFA